MRVNSADLIGRVGKKVVNYRGHPALEFENVARDFSVTLLYDGITKSGNIRLREILSEGFRGIERTRKRFAKPEMQDDGTIKFWLREPGSPLNSYVLRGV